MLRPWTRQLMVTKSSIVCNWELIRLTLTGNVTLVLHAVWEAGIATFAASICQSDNPNRKRIANFIVSLLRFQFKVRRNTHWTFLKWIHTQWKFIWLGTPVWGFVIIVLHLCIHTKAIWILLAIMVSWDAEFLIHLGLEIGCLELSWPWRWVFLIGSKDFELNCTLTTKY